MSQNEVVRQRRFVMHFADNFDRQSSVVELREAGLAFLKGGPEFYNDPVAGQALHNALVKGAETFAAEHAPLACVGVGHKFDAKALRNSEVVLILRTTPPRVVDLFDLAEKYQRAMLDTFNAATVVL